MARMHIACWPRITFYIHAYHGIRACALTFTCAPWDACTRTDFHMCTTGCTHMHWLSHVHHGIHAHALTFTCVPWVTSTGNDLHMCIMGCMHLHSFTRIKQMYPILYIFAPNTVNSNSNFFKSMTLFFSLFTENLLSHPHIIYLDYNSCFHSSSQFLPTYLLIWILSLPFIIRKQRGF